MHDLPIIRILILIGVSISCLSGLFGQDDNFIGSSNQFNTDTTIYTERDSVIVKNAFFKLFTGKPGRAALYSLVIPGGGQIYNKKYWKAPIVWAIDGGLGYNLLFQNNQYRKYQNLYVTALATGDNNVLLYKENRDQFRRAKEFAWMYLILGHLLTTIDAYVDRHLIEFDISSDISYSVHQQQPIFMVGIFIPLNH
ncbi:MAG: DUF5683 domain-containing protein [Saprospiraceae bacterium]